MNSSPSNDGINLGIAVDATGAFSDISTVGVLLNPANEPSIQLGWTTLRSLNVVKGVAQTIRLFGRHELGDASINCTGTLLVQTVFLGTPRRRRCPGR